MENENYEGISKIYDMMMLGVDYEGWADYILDVAKSMGATPKTAWIWPVAPGALPFLWHVAV